MTKLRYEKRFRGMGPDRVFRSNLASQRWFGKREPLPPVIDTREEVREGRRFLVNTYGDTPSA